ncbi:hypothetical protein CR513_35101, partial [Mucuna pruriens]
MVVHGAFKGVCLDRGGIGQELRSQRAEIDGEQRSYSRGAVHARCGEPTLMENNDRTLEELSTPDVVHQPWCIHYPQLEQTQTYELKFGHIHLLPKFHGLAGKDPYKNLKEFHVVCSTMRLQEISKDYTKMKAFPFCLDGAANHWLYLQPVLCNTWGDMKKFFSVSRTATIRKEICGIRQHSRETLYEY